MTDIEQTIRDIYRATGSMKATARETGHSWQTVRRVLMQYGDYANDRAGQIAELAERGMSPEAIAAALKIGKNTVLSYLPYTRTPYISPDKTDNARRIAECRQRIKAGERRSAKRGTDGKK